MKDMAVTLFAIQIDVTIMIQTRICYQTFQKQQQKQQQKQLKIQQSKLLIIMWTWFSQVLWSLQLYFLEHKNIKYYSYE